jgi:hypothetical protein
MKTYFKGYLIKIILVTTISLLNLISVIAHPGWGIEHDSKGNLFFTDIVNKTIWKLDTDGNLSAFSKEKWSHQLIIDDDDNIYICDEEYKMGNGWNSVIKISPDGEESYIIHPTKYGKEFSGTLIAIDENENVYFEYRNKIYIKTLDDNPALYLNKDFKGITNLKYLKDKLYIVDKDEIFRIDRNKILSVIANNFINPNPQNGAYGGRYNWAAGIDLDEDGNLFIAYYGDSRVLKVLNNSSTDELYFSKGNWYPMGVEYYKDHLYILEEGHASDDGLTALRIIKLNSDGKNEVLVSMGYVGGKSVKKITKMSKTQIELQLTYYFIKFYKFPNRHCLYGTIIDKT